MECETCKGTGLVGVYPTQKVCTDCGGKGKVAETDTATEAPAEQNTNTENNPQPTEQPAQGGGILKRIFG